MKCIFLLIYIIVLGKIYMEFKIFENGFDYDICVLWIIDEFDELVYLYIKKDVVYYINVDYIESLDIEEVIEG